MKKLGYLLILLYMTNGLIAQEKVDYLNESEDDFEHRMEWFVDAKYGMFIHFGLYSQLGGVWKGKEIAKYAEWIHAYAYLQP